MNIAEGILRKKVNEMKKEIISIVITVVVTVGTEVLKNIKKKGK